MSQTTYIYNFTHRKGSDQLAQFEKQ